MENIRHFFGIDLSTSSIRTLSKKDNGAILYPYKDVLISVSEVHICPFCGKRVHEFECDCKAFSKAFEKLQDSYGDAKHESCLHRSEFDPPLAFSKSISEFKVKTLTKKDVLDLGLDLWDYATRHSDNLTDRSYLVTPATLEGENLFLLCKDLVSKTVYRFDIQNIEYKDKVIFLGIHSKRTVPGRDPRRIGNYRFEYYWKNFKKFEDWNEVCKALKKI